MVAELNKHGENNGFELYMYTNKQYIYKDFF